MALPDRLPPAPRVFSLLLVLAAAAMPETAIAAPPARLVHCGADTCLRIFGHRSNSAVAVRIAGHDVAVEGDRSWRATLALTLIDTSAKTEINEVVALPPGALGKRIELASLVVRVH